MFLKILLKKHFIKLQLNYPLNVSLLKEFNYEKNKIKNISKEQAIKDVDKLKKDLFNFRFQKINGQIKSYSKISETRKNIARLKTFLRSKNA